MSDDNQSVLDKLLAGPNATTKHVLRDGTEFYSRAGTRNERNKIEQKMRNEDLVMDAIAATLWFRLSDSSGERILDGDKKAYQQYVDSLDLDVAAEMALIIRRQSEPEEGDDLTLDERVEKHLKNSKAQKEAT